MQSSINYEEVIEAAYQIKANAEHAKSVIRNNRSSVSGKLEQGGLSSMVATDTIISTISNVSKQADEVYNSVLKICELIANNVPAGYKFVEESIKNKFADLTQVPTNIQTNSGTFENYIEFGR